MSAYRYQQNQGKHVAHNYATSIAHGELLMVLDSDDELLPDCLQNINDSWLSIPKNHKDDFAGIEGLCITSEGKLHGTSFPQDVFDSNYLEMRHRYGVKGEKRNALRVEVLKKYPYPAFLGEYHIRPSYIWKKISHRYKFRYINKPLQKVDFALNGLTKTSSERRLKNIQGLFHYWKDDIFHHQYYLNKKQKVKHYAEYIRYGLHCKVSIFKQWQEVPDRLTWFISLHRALPNYISDIYKKKYKNV